MSLVTIAADPGRPKRIRLTARQREEQLLDVAEELFTEHGYEGVSLEDIARGANVTRPIVYQHYGSKDGVFLGCVRRARTQFEHTILERVNAASDELHDQISAGSSAYFDLIESNPHRFALLFTTSASLRGELADELTTLRAGTIDAIAALARRQRPDLKPEAAAAFAYAVSGIGEQLGRWWLTKPSMTKRRVLTYYTAAVEGTVASILSLPIATAKR